MRGSRLPRGRQRRSGGGAGGEKGLWNSYPRHFPDLELPSGVATSHTEQWDMFLRHAVNLFYRCAAVESVDIRQRGHRFRHWEIKLFHGNNTQWLEPYVQALVERIRRARLAARYEAAPDTITVRN